MRVMNHVITPMDVIRGQKKVCEALYGLNLNIGSIEYFRKTKLRNNFLFVSLQIMG
jgi:hypothetical protein